MTGRKKVQQLLRLAFSLGLFLCVLRGTAYGDIPVGELRLEPGSGEWPMGRPITDVRFDWLPSRFPVEPTRTLVSPGDRLSGELLRRAMRQLSESGLFIPRGVRVETDEQRCILYFVLEPRRLLSRVRVIGSALSEGEALRALKLSTGDEVTEAILLESSERLRLSHERAGYFGARVQLDLRTTDDPRAVLLEVTVRSGPRSALSKVEFWTDPHPADPAFSALTPRFSVAPTDPIDEETFVQAAREFQLELRDSGYLEAEVTHETRGAVLRVLARTGPKYSIRLFGNRVFGEDELKRELGLDQTADLAEEAVALRLKKFYVTQGFLDAEVTFRRTPMEQGRKVELLGTIDEGVRFEVKGHVFTCQGQTKDEGELVRITQGALAEHFKGPSLAAPPHRGAVEGGLEGKSDAHRKAPYRYSVETSFSEEAYETVQKRLLDAYRDDGYLEARVGPLTLARRTCRNLDGPCDPRSSLALLTPDCETKDPALAESQLTYTCNSRRGQRCEAEGTVMVPIYPGKQAILYELELNHMERFSREEALAILALPVLGPFRYPEVEAAVRRLRDAYLEEGYAYAEIENEVELSTDKTRVRLTLGVTERRPVRISRIVVRGADRTRESLVRSRLSLVPGALYRKSDIESSERQLESLGVFGSVAIGLEDPGLPAKDKVVVVTVAERTPQYLDVRGGFSTGEGVRIGFEYGHRNVGGEAIQLTLRSQLGIRPLLLIFEDDVREKYESLALGDLLERRNTATVSFPEIGLGPLFRLDVEGLDAHTNQRDFSQNRDAGILRLSFRPHMSWFFQTGATVELNEARILFAERDLDGDGVIDGRQNLEDFVQENPEFGRTIRVPEGQSLAITQNLTATWDRRDRPLSARRGTYLSSTLEHVYAIPLGEDDLRCNEEQSGPFDAACSELLRISGRVSGYIPLRKDGLTLALSLKTGVIAHLEDSSRTYPDRLFFLGGVDSLRSHPQDSLVPEDIAAQLLDPDSGLGISEVALRGGDFFINPRAELRIAILSGIETALFLDAGNLWADRSQIDLTRLRYALGTGLRFDTPVGPLVFDYGFNIDRVLDGIYLSRANKRTWEPIGAFHFSIGLF